MTPTQAEQLDVLARDLYADHPAARLLLEASIHGATEDERIRASAALTALDPMNPIPDVQRRAQARGDRGAQALLRLVEARGECRRCQRDACAGDCPATRAYPLRSFLGLALAAREPLLVGPTGAPVLRQKDTGMIFAPTGVGKSWLVQGIALAVASRGRFLKWRASARRRVLLVDGELPAGTLQDRFRALLPAIESSEDPDLCVLAADVQDEPLPSLAGASGQARVEEHLAGVSLLVLDNVSTLMPTMDENDAAAWEPAQQWLLSLRRRGVAVLLAHHAGRAGHARGTSRREDVLDLVIRLNRPSDYQGDQGARFEVVFQKARGVAGADAEAFEARLEGGEWHLADVANRNRDGALELLEQGARPGEVAEALGISRAQAFRYQREGRREGILDDPKARKRKRAVS
jgi:putative DNA primase/helicase